jgi:enoyl-CoA hydratase/carnithine racemase
MAAASDREPALLFERDGPLGYITLNRRHRRNAWNGEMYDLLEETVGEIAHDDSIRCVIVIGAGGNFSSGGDLAWYRARRAEARSQGRFFQYGYPSYAAMDWLRVPVIAAIDGYCLMAGLHFATFYCDIRIASDRATLGFAIPETGGEPAGALGNLGVYPTPYTWHMSLGDVLYMAVAGQRFTAEAALRAGLVQEVVPAASLLERATELGQRVALLPSDRVQASKELYRRYLEASGGASSTACRN